MVAQILKSEYNVGGLRVQVFATPKLRESSEPVAVLLALHGRLGHSGHLEATANDMVKWAGEKKTENGAKQRDLVVVTFDQRNHGHRLVEALGNQQWSDNPAEHNERHAIDMYSIQTGTAKDVSFVIDFLPAYLFPNDERTVAEWGLMGVSLGGHATWLALKDDTRIRVGIPIIGCPDYLTLIQLRADKSGFSLGPPYMPESLRAVIKRSDPPSVPYTEPNATNPFFGKKILVLSGADDPLVQWSASRAFIEALEVGQEGKKQVMLMEGVKHQYTEAMKREAFEFIWEEALLVQKSSL